LPSKDVPAGAAPVLAYALRLRWIPRIHWIAFTKARSAVHIAPTRKLPVVAGCRCLFFGSRVASCGIHRSRDCRWGEPAGPAYSIVDNRIVVLNYLL
jgi:hypothetical protein